VVYKKHVTVSQDIVAAGMGSIAGYHIVLFPYLAGRIKHS